jgi:Flp pilus assembly pilin Flp
MTKLMNRFRRSTRNSAVVKDDRGLSTVEYVIILVLIAAAAVGTWTTFGKTITGKISDSNATIGSVTIPPATQ